MSTVALEFVPPIADGGVEKAQEEANKVKQLLVKHNIDDQVNSLIIPGIIEEDPDRPVALQKKLDPMDTWKAVRDILPLECRVTQVTAFHSEDQLTERFRNLRSEGIDHAVCVGVPRTMEDGEGNGVPPTEALQKFKKEMPSRGVILIPTREGEQGRFKYKIDQGADFAMCQLLYSDYIVDFLRDMTKQTDERPTILLSFGHVPKAETQKGLIRWLIKDEGNPLVEKEVEFVSRLAEMDPDEKLKEMKDLYQRVVEGVRDLGFPIGVYLEAPYGFSDPAFRTFAGLLDTWSPVNEEEVVEVDHNNK